MSPTLNIFSIYLSDLQEKSIDFFYIDGSPPAIRISAKNDLLGALNIYDDGDELTVVIGDKHHAHFSAYNYESHQEVEKLALAVQDAAQFVDDILRDKVCITVDYLDDQCVGSSHFYIDEDNKNFSLVRGIDAGSLQGEKRSEQFLWSGTIQ